MKRARLAGVTCVLCVLLCRAATPAPAGSDEELRAAEALAWAKQFNESERLYRSILERQPDLRQARLGLARVVMWQGRYAEARQIFETLVASNPRDVDALEGRATAAYWKGDFRSAEKEFRRVLKLDATREFSATGARDIAAVSRPTDRLIIDAVRDDQPFENTRAETSTSIFSDPLTRWDVAIGNYSLNAPDEDTTRNVPYVMIGNATVLPWQRLTVTPSIGAIRYPDGAILPIGGLSLRLRLSSHTALEASASQRELLTNVADRYRYWRHFDVRWERQLPQSWLAALHAGQVTYADDNSGSEVDAYVLMPVSKRGRSVLSAGLSAAWRDTRDSRFFPSEISATRDPIFPTTFNYSYRGRYIPYFTPQRVREARGIVAIETTLRQVSTRLQIDGGRARDDGTGFGPVSGPDPLPSQIFRFSFPRQYSPWRLRVTANAPLRKGVFFEAAYEHSDTVHYRANSFHASVARRR